MIVLRKSMIIFVALTVVTLILYISHKRDKYISILSDEFYDKYESSTASVNKKLMINNQKAEIYCIVGPYTRIFSGGKLKKIPSDLREKINSDGYSGIIFFDSKYNVILELQSNQGNRNSNHQDMCFNM